MHKYIILGAVALAALAVGSTVKVSADTTSRMDRAGTAPSHVTGIQVAHKDDMPISVEGAYVQQSIGKSGSSGAYMTLFNHGPQDDQLLGVSTPVAGRVQIHRTSIGAGGIARMRPVDAVPVPAGGMAELKPGGLHIMLMRLNKALEPGTEVPITLIFEKAGEVTVTVPVTAIGQGGANHESMNMDHGRTSHEIMDAEPSNRAQ